MVLKHHTLNPFDRKPQGAVATGGQVRLRLTVEDEQAPVELFLRVWNGDERRYPMRSLGLKDGRMIYEAQIGVGDKPRLLWYRFECEYKGEHVVLGEVWEDASHKVAYGQMRSYVLGDTLDSVMNYPLRDALIAFLMAQKDAAAVAKELSSLAQNYPKPFLYALMNLMGSHDRPRILNVLAGNDGSDIPRSQRADHRLSQEERMIGALREQLMLRFVFSVPGMPCIYYGDEAGVEGCADPFCRRTYPWGREDQDMLARYKAMAAMRNGHPVLKTGECAYIAPCSAVLGVIRKNENGKDAFGKKAENACAVTLINRSAREVVVYLTSADVSCAQTLVSDDGQIFTARSGAFSVKIKGLQGMTMFAM